MRRLLVGLVSLAILLAMLVWSLATLGTLITGSISSYQAERQTIELQQAWSDFEREQAVKNALLPWLITAQKVGIVILEGVLLVAVLVGIDMYLHRRRPLVRITDGQAPIARRVVEADATPALLGIRGYQAAAKTRAAIPLPSHVYSPTEHTVYQNRQEGLLRDGEETQHLLAAPPVPTLGEAVQAGLFRDGKYLLGYTPDGTPLRLDAPVSRSLLIAGHGGAGGTTAIASAALQELLIPPAYLRMREPARYILLDSHGHKPESLTHRLQGLGDQILLTARTPAEVGRAVEEFRRLLQRRLDRPAPPGGYSFAVVLLVDEANDLFEKDSDYTDQQGALAAAFLFANNEARGVGGKAIARFHAIPAQAIGGRATVRRGFRTRLIFALDPADGELLGLPPALARDLLTLPTGECMVIGPGISPQRVRSPNVGPGDLDWALAAAGLLERGRGGAGRTFRAVLPPDPPPDPPRSTAPIGALPPDGARDDTGTVWDGLGRPPAAAPVAPLDATAQEILTLYGQGVDVTRIVKTLWPELEGKGKTLNEYQEKLKLVNNVIRQWWRGPGVAAS